MNIAGITKSVSINRVSMLKQVNLRKMYGRGQVKPPVISKCKQRVCIKWPWCPESGVIQQNVNFSAGYSYESAFSASRKGKQNNLNVSSLPCIVQLSAE